METKEQVLNRFLDFVLRSVPLPQVRVATLGGQGLEAQAWAQRGIPPQHGSLIEINGTLARSLMKKFRYRNHDRLSAFHKVLGSYGEAVDGFHLDLCGTMMGEVVKDFGSILPYILKSKGRCLAITVADARRNRALDKWKEYADRGYRFFGDDTGDVLGALEDMQCGIPVKRDLSLPAFFKTGFDAQKGAKREFGLLVEVAELLYKVHSYMPVEVERYVYVSRYNRHPFRMRTYFFHFGQERDTPYSFARTWVESPLLFANGEQFVTITPAAPAATMKEDLPTMSTSQLAALAAAAGGEAAAEYKTLCARSATLDEIYTKIDLIRSTPAKPPASASVKLEPGAKKSWDSLSKRDQILWLLDTLESKSRSNGKWENGGWEEHLKQSFGRYSAKLGRSLRSAIAHTNGKFRSHFVARIKDAFGSKAAPVLERFYAATN